MSFVVCSFSIKIGGLVCKVYSRQRQRGDEQAIRMRARIPQRATHAPPFLKHYTEINKNILYLPRWLSDSNFDN